VTLGATLVARARHRGGFAYTQAVAALLSAPPALRDRMLAAGDRAQRRFILDTGLAQGWWPPEALFSLAVAEPDVRTRARAAEIVCRQAVWTRQIDTLRRLARHPRPEIRAVALTGLARVGCDAEVAEHLDDPVALVRAIARSTGSARRKRRFHGGPHTRTGLRRARGRSTAGCAPTGYASGLPATAGGPGRFETARTSRWRGPRSHPAPGPASGGAACARRSPARGGVQRDRDGPPAVFLRTVPPDCWLAATRLRWPHVAGSSPAGGTFCDIR
jgi:hypothetical protein